MLKRAEEYDSLEAVRQELLKDAVRAARASLATTYWTVNAIEKPKLKRVQAAEKVALEALARAVWIANGYRLTPFYWEMKAIELAKLDPAERG
jgi:TRAP-type mannitol/chloroaromatic compound transport system substrate-binding protein